ncbi:MraY family glycosyltransferase [Methylopila sp. 73B]|uniref:MraY family glycosyltransferase n=1 Tax=Methylopila sp. 73B TaxID=1120792 RepID=UPI0003728991|nr:MraY family glycosyltransferase [Methylopila sp. 73B]
MTSYAPQLLNAFLLTVVLVAALRAAAVPLGLVDRPDERKRHIGQVPLVGGLAMFPAFVVASLSLAPDLRVPWSAFAGFAAFVAIGAADDRFCLRAAPRLLMQFAAAALAIAPAGVVVEQLGGGWDAGLALGALALPFTLVFVVGLANAFNMADGLDGLAGGVAAGALFWLAITAMALERTAAAIPLLPLLFAVLGFLVFNLRHRWRARASVFMGDAGSLLLGAGVAYFVATFACGDGRVASFVALLWTCALPIVETLSLIVRRLGARRSPMAADRRHLHHILVDGGVPAGRATALIVGASLALGAVGFIGAVAQIDDAALLAGLAAVGVGHSLFVVYAPQRLPAWLVRPPRADAALSSRTPANQQGA